MHVKMDHEIKMCDDKQGAKKILPSNTTLSHAWLYSFVMYVFQKISLPKTFSKHTPLFIKQGAPYPLDRFCSLIRYLRVVHNKIN